MMKKLLNSFPYLNFGDGSQLLHFEGEGHWESAICGDAELGGFVFVVNHL